MYKNIIYNVSNRGICENVRDRCRSSTASTAVTMNIVPTIQRLVSRQHSSAYSPLSQSKSNYYSKLLRCRCDADTFLNHHSMPVLYQQLRPFVASSDTSHRERKDSDNNESSHSNANYSNINASGDCNNHDITKSPTQTIDSDHTASKTENEAPAALPRGVSTPKGAYIGNFPSIGAVLDAPRFYNHVPFVGEEETIVEASRFLEKYDVGCVPVLNEKTKLLVGMFSERDVARWVGRQGVPKYGAREGIALPNALVRDIMTRGVITCYEDISLTQALGIMDENNFRHLPVVARDGDPSRVIGLLSMRDVIHQQLKIKDNGSSVSCSKAAEGRSGSSSEKKNANTVDEFMQWVLKMSS